MNRLVCLEEMVYLSFFFIIMLTAIQETGPLPYQEDV